MVKTLIKHGNSYALVIDRPIMELLRIAPETPLEIVCDGEHLFIIPIREPGEERKFQKALANVHHRFGHAMEVLAKEETPSASLPPARNPKRRQSLRRSLKKMNRLYGDDLRRLGE